MPEMLMLPNGKPIDIAPPGPSGDPATDDRVMHPAPPRRDHEAPYGRQPDGKPRQRPKSEPMPKARVGAKPATGKGKPSESAEAALQRRRQGIVGIAQVGSAVTLGMHGRTNDAAWLADTYTLQSSAEQLGQAVADVCQINPEVAHAVDRVTAIGP